MTDTEFDFNPTVALDTIIRLRGFYSDEPSRWCQGAEAKSQSGEELFFSDEAAVSWCLLGGSGFVDPKGAGTDADRAMRYQLDHIEGYRTRLGDGGDIVQDFNDAPETTLEMVDAFLGRCIETLERIVT